MEYNLVEVWLRKDPARWIAGAFAGLLAGAVAMAVAMMIAASQGFEAWFPAKLVGTILLGPSATEIGLMGGVVAGLFLFEVVCLIFGMIYAHFTGTNNIKALLGMGLVWGAFSWVFIWNLFMQSFKPIFAAQIPSTPVFPVCIAYGLSLASVAFFDRLFRSKA